MRRLFDNYELGNVKQVTDEYIYTEKGLLQKEKFFVPRRSRIGLTGRPYGLVSQKVKLRASSKGKFHPAWGEFAKRSTTVEKRITEKTVETLPSAEQKETVQERTA